MEHVFVDTNIVIDLLQKRENFYKEAQELFTKADRKKLKLYISALTFANTYYILSKYYSSSEAKKILSKFKVLVEVLPTTDKIIDLALASDFNDFEDAIQFYTALESNLHVIITRNKKDFKNNLIPVFSAKEFLKK
ncbi:MAG: PIN domain-containing protein [Cloacibacterium normanense]|jgi:predicted nucleic acid-binding protein